MKKISLQDISKSLNISKPTISLVLNGRGDEKRVSKETQEKILKFAKEHNYKPNHLARGLSRGKSDTIGLVIPNISDIFYARIARRIERKAEKSGYNVVFSSTGESKERESELIQSMLDRQVDGLIIASSQKNEKDILQLKKMNFPFVLIDRHYPKIATNHVVINNANGVAQAVSQLVKNGKKRIGFVSIKTELEAIHQRLLGYKNEMQKNKLLIEDGFIQELVYENLVDDMAKAIKKMVGSSICIHGIVFATHYLAAEGIRELKKNQVRIPEDVALISFGQMDAFDLVEPPVTSVKLPSDEIGDEAVDILLQNMKEGGGEYKQRSLDANLVVRKSCGRR